MPTCRDCGETDPAKFYKRNDCNGYKPRCKKCHNKYQTERARIRRKSMYMPCAECGKRVRTIKTEPDKVLCPTCRKARDREERQRNQDRYCYTCDLQDYCQAVLWLLPLRPLPCQVDYPKPAQPQPVRVGDCYV